MNPAIPFHRPSLREDEIRAVVRVLRSGWLTSGPRVAELEAAFRDRLGAPYAVAVSSGTAALELALAATDLGSGHRVVTTPYSFAASSEVIVRRGATPVFVDVDPVTLNLCPTALEETVTRLATRNRPAHAILPVHFGGEPCDLDAIDGIARRFEIPVIEDAAHAFPATWRRVPIGGPRAGGQTRAVAFSFYANKTITTGEGGMLTTDDAELAERCRRLRLHGLSRDTWTRVATDRDQWATWQYDLEEAGFKANLSDIAAALGLVQLARADELCAARQRIAARYDAAFRDHPQLVVPPVREDGRSSRHLYVIRLRLGRCRTPEARDQLGRRLLERGIGTSVHYRPLHLFTFYRRLLTHRPEDFPNALSAYRRALSLPIYPDLDDAEVERVVEVVLEEVQNL